MYVDRNSSEKGKDDAKVGRTFEIISLSKQKGLRSRTNGVTFFRSQ